MAAEIFTHRFPVDPADIDELGHVNNIVYLRYAQEIAIAHWRARATQEMIETYVWVVTRHEVDYRAPLEEGDPVVALPRVHEAAGGATWKRFVDIYKAGGDRPSARIVSDWCLLDAKTRRVKRVPAEIVARFVNVAR